MVCIPYCISTIDDYAKDGGPGEVWHLCSFYHESLRTWVKTIVNKFAISNPSALILRVHALRSHLKLICEYELHSLPNKKLVAQRIMVKTTSKSNRPWSSIFYVIVYLLGYKIRTVLRHVLGLKPTTMRFQVLGIPPNFAGPFYWSFWACRTVSKFKICC